MAKIHLKKEDLVELEEALIKKALAGNGVITSLDVDSVADQVLPVAKRPTRQTLIKFLNEFGSFEEAKDLGRRPLRFRLVATEAHKPEPHSIDTKEQEHNEHQVPTNQGARTGDEYAALPAGGLDNPVFLSGEKVLLVLTPAEFVRVQSILQGERNAGT